MHQKNLPIPPRKQWEGNHGYCGETAMICCGLYYGQYVSQYDARAFASDDDDQSKEGSQLLVGAEQNDRHAAGKMHLTSLEWDSDGQGSTQAFLTWVKRQVVNDVPVVISVYMNKSVFGDDVGDDDEYDHIVAVIGIESNHPLSDASYFDDDVIVFSDNGLYTPEGDSPPYIFRCPFGDFPKTREEANQPASPVYSLALLTDGVKNYGVAVTGIMTDGSTLPVRVATEVNYERPEIADGSGTRPAPMRLGLTVTVSALEPGVAYKLYRYDRMDKVPDGEFNRHASNAARTWDIVADSTGASVTQEILSDEVAVYRAVKASAP
jgi:hypothetical protein